MLLRLPSMMESCFLIIDFLFDVTCSVVSIKWYRISVVACMLSFTLLKLYNKEYCQSGSSDFVTI